VAPVGVVAKYIRERQDAQIQNLVETPSEIGFGLTSALDSVLFNQELSLRLYTDRVHTVLVNNGVTSYTDYGNYIIFNIRPTGIDTVRVLKVLPVCGNALLETGEECDDGNLVNLDGCSSLCKVELPNCPDNDSDGYYSNGACGTPVDCDDSKSFVYPGAPDTSCNGIDNDCDSLIDEDYSPYTCGQVPFQAQSTCLNGTETCAVGEGSLTYVLSTGWTVTSYNDADEKFFDGPKVEVFDSIGNSLGFYKDDFLMQIQMDGSGLGDGVNNPNRYLHYDYDVDDGKTCYLMDYPQGAYLNKLVSWTGDKPSVAVNPLVPFPTMISFKDLGPYESLNEVWVNDLLRSKIFFADDQFHFGEAQITDKKIDIYTGLQTQKNMTDTPENIFMENVTIYINLSCTDGDNDGYHKLTVECPIGDDCNDNADGINPGATEICNNGLDDDCDGDVDVGDASCICVPGETKSCPNQAGVCAGSIQTCNLYGQWPGCDYSLVQGYVENDTSCDNMDNDCDGLVDEGYVAVPTSCGVGACAANGQLRCVSGTQLDSCTPGLPAVNDSICNLIDDDCDGLVDEDCVISSICQYARSASATSQTSGSPAIYAVGPPDAPKVGQCSGWESWSGYGYSWTPANWNVKAALTLNYATPVYAGNLTIFGDYDMCWERILLANSATGAQQQVFSGYEESCISSLTMGSTFLADTIILETCGWSWSGTDAVLLCGNTP